MKTYIKEFIDNVLIKNNIPVMVPVNKHSNYAFFFVSKQMFKLQEDYIEGKIRFSTVNEPTENIGSSFALNEPYHGICVGDINIEYILNLPKLKNQKWSSNGG